jgi:hypothetical protein
VTPVEAAERPFTLREVAFSKAPGGLGVTVCMKAVMDGESIEIVSGSPNVVAKCIESQRRKILPAEVKISFFWSTGGFPIHDLVSAS